MAGSLRNKLIAIGAAVACSMCVSNFMPSPGATFSTTNTVSLPVELVILVILFASFLGGVALFIRILPRGPWIDFAIAGVIAAGSFLWLNSLNGPAWAGHDQATGLVMAADCLKLSQCHLTSVDSGIRGFTNGAMWLHLLTAIGYVGGTTVAARNTIIALMAAGIAAVYLCTNRWLRPQWAFPAASLGLFGVGGAGELFVRRDVVGPLAASNFIDASVVFLPATLVACFLLAFVLTRQPLALVAAAVFASHAMNTHVAAVSLMPALIACAALAGDGPAMSVGIAVSVTAAMTLISSPYAAATSLQRLQRIEVLEIIAAIGALALVCAFLRSRFLKLGTTGRAAVVAAFLVLPSALGAAWLSFDHRPPTSRYLAPIIAPLAVAFAGILASTIGSFALTRRWLPAAVAAGLVFVARTPIDRSNWEFEDGRILSKTLGDHGWCYSRQFGRLQGPRCTTLADATMPYACRSPALMGGRQQWRVWLADNSNLPTLPRDSEVLQSSRGRAVIASPIDSWVDKPAGELCIDSAGAKKCMPPDAPDADPFLYSHRLALGFKDASVQMPFTMSFTFPVRPVAGQTHLFSFGEIPFPLPADEERVSHCGWQVVRADGLLADPPLPANPVRLTSRDGASGQLVIERKVGVGQCNDGFPGEEIPCHWETTADDPAWMSQPQ